MIAVNICPNPCSLCVSCARTHARHTHKSARCILMPHWQSSLRVTDLLVLVCVCVCVCVWHHPSGIGSELWCDNSACKCSACVLVCMIVWVCLMWAHSPLLTPGCKKKKKKRGKIKTSNPSAWHRWLLGVTHLALPRWHLCERRSCRGESNKLELSVSSSPSSSSASFSSSFLICIGL